MTLERLYSASVHRLFRLLRWRVWLQERLQPSEWQLTLWWAGMAGVLGAGSARLFTFLTEGVHELFTGSRAGIVESMRQSPPWLVVLVPALGGAAAGLVLLLGKRLAPGTSSTDYMEAIAIGSGRIPVRASLAKCAAALFSIGSGGSIGREGPMVQLAAVIASSLGRWRRLTAPQQRLLVACGAASGLASAYNAPIGGSFFVAEIILGSIAMENLGPLAVAAVAAALTTRATTSASHLYEVPAFRLESLREIGPYIVLAVVIGTLCPWFLRTLRQAERIFARTRWPLIVRLAGGGLVVGALAVFVPEVCGNGYPVVVGILHNAYAPSLLLLILALKWLATAASFGSGAPGGVFTPTLFMGASTGLLFGTAVQSLWPAGVANPAAFALVGMGAFLAAASHAPVMAIIMLFEMTLSYDIILPLMLCSVIAYFTAKGLENHSLYGDALARQQVAKPAPILPATIFELMRPRPPTLRPSAGFDEIAREFLAHRVNNLYVVDEAEHFRGAVALHDIKPFLHQPELATVVLASDILREDFPHISMHGSLAEALEKFRGLPAERLPVTDDEGRLMGSLSKEDLLLTLAQRHTPQSGANDLAA